MTTPNDIPGYVQGFITQDNPLYYNGSNTFYDVGPYAEFGGRINDLTLLAGTPTFDTVQGVSALRLDNSSHWEFLPSGLWEGSAVFVLKTTYVSGGTITKYPLQMNPSSSLTSTSGLRLGHFSSTRNLTYGSPSHNIVRGVTNDNARVVMFSASQETRRNYSSEGSTPTVGSALAAANSGINVGIGVAADQKAVIGSAAAVSAGTTPQTDLYMHLLEVHFWDGPVLLTHEADCLSLIADLKTKYGI